jgi:hypothetical protein
MVDEKRKLINKVDFFLVFLEIHSPTQKLTTHTHTHPYEYTYANSTPMSTFERLSTGRFGDSRSYHSSLASRRLREHRLPLTHNAGISPGKGASTMI